ncbi:hypothetical protein AK830_g940 [Neonectria ditissima]|uniref:Transcription factor domain-containing protein n=1 Tax=Neonectria ditissima TaxID=78410 RepID=A0A0P7B6P9_9HYPO|nr:hypothetical protein AK830_g940 [Neonectria ditissima]
MAASSQSTQTKLALGETIKKTLTQRIFLDNDPRAATIDLLLGLLTFLAWSHDYILHGNAVSLSRFTQLAMTLVFDLRLNKPLPEHVNMLPIGSTAEHDSHLRHPSRTLEERRAVLGCFVMSSIVSSYFAQIDAMQWTPYMEECLEIVSRGKECSHDELFAYQVRLQRIAGEADEARSTPKVPPAFYISALQHKVDEIKARVSPQLQRDGTFLAHIFHTELSICSLVLSKQSTPDLQRLELLYTCLNTTRLALDHFFEFPIAEYPGTSFPLFTQLARYIVVLYKLSTFKDPIWDTRLARSTVDVVQVVDRLIGNILQAREAFGDESADGLLDKSIRIFKAFRSQCVANLDDGVGGDSEISGTERGARKDGSVPDPFLLDEMWFMDSFS